jgi:hypothetical protein
MFKFKKEMKNYYKVKKPFICRGRVLRYGDRAELTKKEAVKLANDGIIEYRY